MSTVLPIAEARALTLAMRLKLFVGCLAVALIGAASVVDSRAPQQAAAAQAGKAPVLVPVASLPLSPDALTETHNQRTLLKYLVGCALPSDVELRRVVGGVVYRFVGELGLAPGWLERGLTESEQRWVSACLLARTNYFGKAVEISLRAADPAPAALQTSTEERQAFSLFEGGFYGNLFSDEPRAYACVGRRTLEQAAEPVFQDRICTAPSGASLPSGETLTKCGFVHSGFCPAPDSFPPSPPTHREVIFTYLKPAGPKARE